MESYEEKIAKLPLLINSILLTVTLVLVQPLFSVSGLDVLQILALTFFALELPAVGGYAYIIYLALGAKVDPFKHKGTVFLSLQYIGLIAGFAGITCIILECFVDCCDDVYNCFSRSYCDMCKSKCTNQ